MRPIVERLGGAIVYATGLDVLGYPPTWVRSFSEALPVLGALNSNPTG